MMAWEQRAVERRRGHPAPVEGRGQRDLFRHLFGGVAGTGRADGVAQPASDDWLTDAFLGAEHDGGRHNRRCGALTE